MHYILLFIMSLLPLVACKEYDESGVQTLDYLVGKEGQDNVCGLGITQHDFRVDVHASYEGKGLDNIAKQTLSAAPEMVRSFFQSLQGQVIVSPTPLSYCPGFQGQNQGLSDGFICWHYAEPTSSSAVSRGQIAGQRHSPSHPVIAVVGDPLKMRHGLLRALGYLFITKLIELNPSPQGPVFLPFNDAEFDQFWTKIVVDIVQDVKQYGHTNHSLVAKLLPEDFIHSERSRQEEILRQNSQFLLAKQSLFAEAFDSFYCNAETRETRMRVNFPRSYESFSEFDRQIKMPEKSMALYNTYPITNVNPYVNNGLNPYVNNGVNPYVNNGLNTNYMADYNARTQAYVKNYEQLQKMQMLVVVVQSLSGLGNMLPNSTLQGGSNFLGGLSLQGNNGIQPLNGQNNSLFNPNNNLGQSNNLNNSLNNNFGSMGSSNEVIRLTNEYRRSQGLGELTEDPTLTAACAEHARWMSDNNSMQHYNTRPDYPGPRDVAENIGRGHGTPAAAVRGWIGSPGHQQNIVNARQTMGAANVGTWWCQQFR